MPAPSHPGLFPRAAPEAGRSGGGRSRGAASALPVDRHLDPPVPAPVPVGGQPVALELVANLPADRESGRLAVLARSIIQAQSIAVDRALSILRMVEGVAADPCAARLG